MLMQAGRTEEMYYGRSLQAGLLAPDDRLLKRTGS